MKLEDFKDIYKDKPLLEKVRLIIDNIDTRAHDMVCAQEARHLHRNLETAKYYDNEVKAMEDRVDWLLEEIRKELSDWTPITEKLPELHLKELEENSCMLSDPILITGTAHGSVEVECFTGFYEEDSDGRTYWYTPDFADIEDVTAWRPCPAPYKEAKA